MLKITHVKPVKGKREDVQIVADVGKARKDAILKLVEQNNSTITSVMRQIIDYALENIEDV